MLDLKNIFLTFNPRTKLEYQVYRKFNLKIEPSEFVMIIGSNGTGKSTLFKLISGELTPDKGTITIEGTNCTHLPNYKRSGLISYVAQDPGASVIPSMTIEENMAFALKRGTCRTLLPYLNKKITQFLEYALDDLKINFDMNLSEYAGNLSGGQRQALSLIMATLAPSKILLLDEHLAALDPKMAEVVMRITEKIIKEFHLTTLMITHNMAHALKYGNRTILLHQGKVLKDIREGDKKNYTPTDLACLFNEV